MKSAKMSDRSVPNPHNDVWLTAVQPATEPEPKQARWPLLVIVLGLVATLAWVSLLGWLVLQFVGWLFN